jgi:hypothetical protein
MTTPIASFDAPTKLNEPMNTVTKPVENPGTLYVEEPSTPYEPSESVKQSTLNVDEPSEHVEEHGTQNVDEPSTPYEPSEHVEEHGTQNVDEPSTRNVKDPVTTPVATSTPVGNPDDSLVIPRHPDPRVKLGYLGINEKPEEAKPPVVYGKIDGRIARIMLDTGCSTYVLSTDFARAGDTPCFPCKPIPVELAVRDASQFNLNTQTKKLPMEVGNITQSKASYVLPLPSCDAIFGMPFLNGRKLIIHSEKGIATLDNIELPLVKDHDDERPSVSMISRSRLKAEIRKNEIAELYLATSKIPDPNPAPENATTPAWINDEYSDVFRRTTTW